MEWSDADNIALILQGHLIAGDLVAEAGLVAQVKAPKREPLRRMSDAGS
jgi:hypothetical protein